MQRRPLQTDKISYQESLTSQSFNCIFETRQNHRGVGVGCVCGGGCHLFAVCTVTSCKGWNDCNHSQRGEPAAPSPSQHGSSAGQPAQHDAAPSHPQTHKGKNTQCNCRSVCLCVCVCHCGGLTISWKTYNPFNESHQLLLVSLPLAEVGLDQRVELRQIFLLTFLMDVLQLTTHTHLRCYWRGPSIFTSDL